MVQDQKVELRFSAMVQRVKELAAKSAAPTGAHVVGGENLLPRVVLLQVCRAISTHKQKD